MSFAEVIYLMPVAPVAGSGECRPGTRLRRQFGDQSGGPLASVNNGFYAGVSVCPNVEIFCKILDRLAGFTHFLIREAKIVINICLP